MKILIIINPNSCGGKHRKDTFFSDALSFLNTVGIEYEALFKENVEEIREMAAKAAGVDAVVACGGDGTISVVADGLTRNPDPELKLGVLYAGTSPDFCRFHHIPIDTREAVALLAAGKSKKIDVMEIRHNGKEEHFCCSCNLGMGADVATLANRLRPRLGDGFGTFCALLWNLLKSTPHDYTVNGKIMRNCNHLLITKTRLIASGLRLDLPLSDNDGKFAVWSVSGLSFFGWLRLLPKLYKGEKAGEYTLREYPIYICSDDVVHVEFDGDSHGTLPVEISLLKQKLNLICGE